MVTEELLPRAQAGDAVAFERLTEPYRQELLLHCYRIMGTVTDAEDLVQDTLFSAWRAMAGFRGHASVRTWLYRIATNRCLNALRDLDRRRGRYTPVLRGGAARAEPNWRGDVARTVPGRAA
jgi:DNA-directed RNA polymerase specialized sigma24 family protein